MRSDRQEEASGFDSFAASAGTPHLAVPVSAMEGLLAGLVLGRAAEDRGASRRAATNATMPYERARTALLAAPFDDIHGPDASGPEANQES